ncbi:hypothetical protein AB0D10_11915 [Kitasatospora sp. NPDC048545]|uniref:hypothetical protein n=1 Tax=Kitasatospora sp. NPDC048545 TaxID=3157208 RepID=UPI0033EA5E09
MPLAIAFMLEAWCLMPYQPGGVPGGRPRRASRARWPAVAVHADRALVRRAGSTDLMVRGDGGSRLQAAWIYLYTALDFLLGAALVGAFIGLALSTMGGNTWVLFLVGGWIGGLVELVHLVVHRKGVFRNVRRVEFAPAGIPQVLRLVRAGRPGEWLPVSRLKCVRIDQLIMEPYEGDLRPPSSSFVVSLVMDYGREETCGSVDGEPQALIVELGALLRAAGVSMELETTHRTRAKPSNQYHIGGNPSC